LAGLAGIPQALETVVPSVRFAAWYVLLPVAVVLLWWRVRQSTDPRRVVTAAGYALAAAVLLSPLVYPWYYVAPIAVLAAVADRHRVRVALATLAVWRISRSRRTASSLTLPGPRQPGGRRPSSLADSSMQCPWKSTAINTNSASAG
jgi:hypothetical protein